MSRISAAQSGREAQRRKRLIAKMLLEGATSLSCEEIAEKLANARKPNGKRDRARRSVAPSGKPWSRATVQRDIAEIEAGWREQARRETSTWKRRIIAQYQELLERYWSSENYDGVLRTLDALREVTHADDDQVLLYDLLQQQMSIALHRIEAHYFDRPALANEFFRVLADNPNLSVFDVPDERPSSPKN